MPLLTASGRHYAEFKNLCIWNKTNAGMGAFYRSKHELVFVFKNGRKRHINNFGLGQYGRARSNVWDYAGATSLTRERLEDLAVHPTVKPTAMVADAMRDCSKRGGIILDPFCGSGTIFMAAEWVEAHSRKEQPLPAKMAVNSIVRRKRPSSRKDSQAIQRDGRKSRPRSTKASQNISTAI